MIRRLLAALALVFLGLLVAAPGASALPVVGSTGILHNGGSLCPATKDPPPVAVPGQGFTGLLDGGDHHSAGTTVYDQYGLAGETWHTYDTGCTGDTWASFTTTIGNVEMSVSVWLIALSDWLHAHATNVHLFDMLDPLMRQATAAIDNAILTPWMPIGLFALALVIFARHHKRKMSRVTTMVIAAVAVMVVAVMVLDAPVQLAHTADTFTANTTGLVDAKFGGHASAGADPNVQRASDLVDTIVYPNWERGMFGSSTSPTARKYGRKLFDAQARTWGQEERIRKDPKLAAKVDHGKGTAWLHWTSEVKSVDPAAYYQLTGHGGLRLGIGFLALAGACLIVLFLIAADFVRFCALLAWRLGLIASVILAPAAILSPKLRLKWVHTMIGAPFVAILYAVAADLQVLNIRIVLSGPGDEITRMLVCGGLSIALWRGLKYVTHLGRFDPVDNLPGRKKTRKFIESALPSGVGSWLGNRFANRGREQHEADEQQQGPGTTYVPSERVENWSRTDPWAAPQPVGYSQPIVAGPADVVFDDQQTVDGQPALTEAQPEVYRKDEAPNPNPRRADPSVGTDGRVVWRVYVPGVNGQPGHYEELPEDSTKGTAT